jgi:hypothetical protein
VITTPPPPLGVRSSKPRPSDQVKKGRVEIPWIQDPNDEGTEVGKRMMAIIDLNDMAFTEFILSYNATSSA